MQLDIQARSLERVLRLTERTEQAAHECMKAAMQERDAALREADALRADAERWQWAKDILSGDDEAVTNAKTLYLGAGLMRGETIEQIIDAAKSAGGGKQ
jgi:hypothetical protein